MTSFVYGCKVGFTEATSPIFLSANSPFEVSKSDLSWMASISYTGTLISVILCFSLTNKVSWKTFIMGSALAFTLSWFLILVTSSMKVIIGCLFLYGVAASILVITAHIYFAEIATPVNRGCLILVYFLATDFGIQLENVVAVFESYRLLAAFPLVVGIVTLVLSIFMVESPYYLVSKGRHEEAVKNLRYLQDKRVDEDMSVELEVVKRYVEEQRCIDVNDFKAIFLPGNLKLLGTIVLIGLPGTFNCTTIIYAYGPLLIQNLEPYVNGATFIHIFSTLRTLSDIFSLVTVKKFNRYTLIFYGQICIGLVHLAIFSCFYLEKKYDYKLGLSFIPNTIAFLLLVLLLIDMLTVGGAMQVYKAEVFPHRLKEFYMSVIAFVSDCVAFVVVKSYFWLLSMLGIDYLVFFYASFSFVGAACAYFLIQETKGKSLNQIRTDYGSSLKT
jgi:SP family galactose:H+ symporter-like MFS transporter